MRGLVVFGTARRDRPVESYRGRLGADEWLDQPVGCTILRFGTLLIGVCDAATAETEGTSRSRSRTALPSTTGTQRCVTSPVGRPSGMTTSGSASSSSTT
jgi:hypothetical protein